MHAGVSTNSRTGAHPIPAQLTTNSEDAPHVCDVPAWTDRRDPALVQKMLRLREAKNGTEIVELLQARASGHKRVWENVETDPGP